MAKKISTVKIKQRLSHDNNLEDRLRHKCEQREMTQHIEQHSSVASIQFDICCATCLLPKQNKNINKTDERNKMT